MLLLLIQSDFCCLVVTRLTGFHCNLKLSMLVGCFFRIFVPHGGKTEFELTHITKFSYILEEFNMQFIMSEHHFVSEVP